MRTLQLLSRGASASALYSLFVVCCCASTVPAAALTLVSDGTARAAIVVAPDADPIVFDAARDMAGILERMSGARLNIVARATGPAVEVGPPDATLAPLEYAVQRDGDRVSIRGGSPNGIANGVYAFLDDLGCRWYLPGPVGEYIPRRATIAVDDLALGDAPDYVTVSGFGGHPHQPAGVNWLRRNRMIGFPQQSHGHNWSSILHPRHKESRPDLFALVRGGERSNHFCTTHPDVLDSAVAAANGYFDARPDAQMYSLSPTDGDDFCRCERCTALDRELGVDPFASGGSITDRLVVFFNAVAERVAERHPDKKLAFYAYIIHTDPPRVVKPHPMLVPVVCHTPWDYCQNHAIGDPECRRNQPLAEAIQGWSELSPDVGVYDYYGQFAWYGPMGIVHAIRSDIPWLREHGVTLFNSETHDNWWTQGLNWYVASRLFWDVGADVDRIVAEWHEHLYGPAAEPMAAYWRVYEDAAASVPYDADYERGWSVAMTPAFFDRTTALLDLAFGLVMASDLPTPEKGLIAERIRRMRVGDRVAAVQSGYERFHSDGDISGIIARDVDVEALLREIESDSTLHDVIDQQLGIGGIRWSELAVERTRRVWTDTRLTDERRDEIRSLLAEGEMTRVADALGFITEWRVHGLYYGPKLEALDVTYPPDESFDLAATYDTPIGPQGWQTVVADNPYGIIDFKQLFSDHDVTHGVVYAYAEVEYHGRKPRGRLLLGSNDGVEVWHNGDRVLKSNVFRPITPDEDRVMVPLRQGTNRFLFKVFNTQVNFKLCARVLDSAHEPVDVDTE